jgi:hypothetical protein
VTLEAQVVDRYGRSVSEVFKEGTNIIQTLVSFANAFVYWQYIRGCDRASYSLM